MNKQTLVMVTNGGLMLEQCEAITRRGKRCRRLAARWTGHPHIYCVSHHWIHCAFVLGEQGQKCGNRYGDKMSSVDINMTHHGTVRLVHVMGGPEMTCKIKQYGKSIQVLFSDLSGWCPVDNDSGFLKHARRGNTRWRIHPDDWAKWTAAHKPLRVNKRKRF